MNLLGIFKSIFSIFIEKYSKTWRFILDYDFEYTSELLKGIDFDNEFVSIHDCKMIIKHKYAWDACSPAIKISLGKLLPQGLWLGTWDGPLNENCLPVTYRAALVHDVLCQFRKEIKITKENSISIFKEILSADKAPGWMVKIYPTMVKYLGPQDWDTNYKLA